MALRFEELYQHRINRRGEPKANYFATPTRKEIIANLNNDLIELNGIKAQAIRANDKKLVERANEKIALVTATLEKQQKLM